MEPVNVFDFLVEDTPDQKDVDLQRITRLIKPKGPFLGWRAKVPISERVSTVYQIYSQPNINTIESALSIERTAFLQAERKKDYDKSIKGGPANIQETRTQNKGHSDRREPWGRAEGDGTPAIVRRTLNPRTKSPRPILSPDLAGTDLEEGAETVLQRKPLSPWVVEKRDTTVKQEKKRWSKSATTKAIGSSNSRSPLTFDIQEALDDYESEIRSKSDPYSERNNSGTPSRRQNHRDTRITVKVLKTTSHEASAKPAIPSTNEPTSFLLSVKRTISEDCTQVHGTEPPLKLHCLEVESRRRTALRLDHLKRVSSTSNLLTRNGTRELDGPKTLYL
ncbi:hypothetical protein BGW36DRAFT_93987 [Talaromyces proteolyticus]|uniref:Uncharacterized protein n=1 Tax=Talaromyces proteolyticus TaxID=1131652 RepID=A0AAD4L0F5_9EURO|nr:uncharacterized protein BGW36DRAFT_93987 [Talaromyces proteolyticus]KAH8703943.1 hypothetical protein BGW36DRAFT_93987 [Talaromyces proteolyticus]